MHWYNKIRADLTTKVDKEVFKRYLDQSLGCWDQGVYSEHAFLLYTKGLFGNFGFNLL